MKSPPLRAIEAFEAFGRHGSVTAAAIELGVSPGAVSQQIRKAEEALGVQLLERRGRTVALTSWGRVYHTAISGIFDRIRNAGELLERARVETALTVSCLPSLASKWLAPQLFDWQAHHVGATVRLIGSEPEARFGDEQVDFRISYGTKSRDYDHYVELFTDWVVPACSPALLARHPLRRPADILERPLLASSGQATTARHQPGPNGRQASAGNTTRSPARWLFRYPARQLMPPSTVVASCSHNSRWQETISHRAGWWSRLICHCGYPPHISWPGTDRRCRSRSGLNCVHGSSRQQMGRKVTFGNCSMWRFHKG